MSFRREEIPNNTPEQVRGYLDDALTIIAELEIDGDLREVAFAKAVDLIAAKQIALEQVGLNLPTMQIPRG